jgi:hypothetical protein
VRTGVGLFVSSALFGIAIATIYWFSSHHYGGTILLGLMATALAFATVWSIAAEREADLDGDDPKMRQSDAAGEDLGIFTTASAWPILMACSALVMLLGALWSPFLLFVGIAAIILILWRLGAESARTGKS